MYMWCKDILDRLLALLAIIVLSPLLLLITIVIRIDSSGKAIFRQERVGKDGCRFTLYKFRTMYEKNDDSQYKALLQRYVLDSDKSCTKTEDGQDAYELVFGPRVTGPGKIFRRTGLDELPQLLNVLKGEMSLIGPRPDIPFAVDMYQPHHHDRLKVKPGITGLWQVSGRKVLPFEEMVRLDIEYINRQSPFLDARIALLTLREVFMRDGR